MIPHFIARIIAIAIAMTGTPAGPNPPDPVPQVVATLVGDSITDMHRAQISEVVAECGLRVDLNSLSGRRIEDSYELDDRWINSGVDEIKAIKATRDPTTWIIELGSNDLPNITTIHHARDRIDAVLEQLDDDDRVIWTTVLFPHFSEASALFNEALEMTPGLDLVAWHNVAADHLADAVHPTEEGARRLGRMYCEALDPASRARPDLRSGDGRRDHHRHTRRRER